MFDTAKVQRMTEGLIKFVREHDNFYLVPESIMQESFALFRRLHISIKAILFDGDGQGNLFGYPLMKTAEAIVQFNERTGLIILVKKPVPFIYTTRLFASREIPVFVMTPEEALAIYDRLTVVGIIQQYKADGLPVPLLQDLSIRFARGVTTFLNPDTELIKVQLWDRNYFRTPKYEVSDTAIVLRGQIVYENHYTEKTLEFYRTVYPQTPIIVSTWKAEITDDFRATCKKNLVVLLENTPPATPGLGHINYQLENAFRGVDYVKNQLGTKYVLVTRTDQRLNRFDFLLHFRNLIQTFPPLGDKLQGRLLTLGAYLTTKHFPFSITDFLLFGFTSDIFKYYYLPRPKGFDFEDKNNPLMPNFNRLYRVREKILTPVGFKKFDLTKYKRKLKNFNVMLSHFLIPNNVTSMDFCRKHIASFDKTTLLETWWKIFRDYWLLVDIETVVFDWAKYEDRRRYTVIFEGARFSQWLDMYRNFNGDWV